MHTTDGSITPPLQAFIDEAEKGATAKLFVLEGGYVIPGAYLVQTHSRGKEESQYAVRQEAGSAARSWEGPRQQAAAPGEAPHSFSGLVPAELRVEELLEYHPHTAVIGSSSTCVYLSVPLGIFPKLLNSAQLHLEVPKPDASFLNDYFGRRNPPGVPAIRAWAWWSDGFRVMSHHMYPDKSICTCIPGQWVWGVDPIHEYVESCLTWIGKSLALSVTGRWPGPQHYSSYVRYRRRMLDEYCGCGGQKCYGDCCYHTDDALSQYDRLRAHFADTNHYLSTLQHQGREVAPPLSTPQ